MDTALFVGLLGVSGAEKVSLVDLRRELHFSQNPSIHLEGGKSKNRRCILVLHNQLILDEFYF
jgi:hypothetical protein